MIQLSKEWHFIMKPIRDCMQVSQTNRVDDSKPSEIKLQMLLITTNQRDDEPRAKKSLFKEGTFHTIIECCSKPVKNLRGITL